MDGLEIKHNGLSPNKILIFSLALILLCSCASVRPVNETALPTASPSPTLQTRMPPTTTPRVFEKPANCGEDDDLGHIFFFRQNLYGDRRHASNFDMYVMNGNGCYPRLVMQKTSGSPAWSKDETRLAVGCENNTFLCILDVKATLSDCSGMDEEERTCRPVALQKFELPLDIGAENTFNNIAWSKDGNKIAVEARGPDDKYTLSILFLDKDGEWKTIFRKFGSYHMDWSPKQDNLITNGLFLLTPMTGHRIRITKEGIYPAWSKDGERIAFVKYSEDKTKEPRGIALTTADGGSWEWLYEPGIRSDPYQTRQDIDIRDDREHRLISWSPDEKFIAFTAIHHHDYDNQIFRLNIESGRVELLTRGAEYCYAPAWGP